MRSQFWGAIILVVFSIGCSGQMNTYKNCSGGYCNTSEELPEVVDVDHDLRIPTTAGGYVALTSSTEIRPANRMTFISGVTYNGQIFFLTHEDLGSGIYRLRTRPLLPGGGLGLPKCDYLTQQYFVINSAILKGDSLYLYQTLSQGTVIHRYSMESCALLESLTFPIYINNYYSTFSMTDSLWLFSKSGSLNIYSRASKVAQTVVTSVSKGSEKLSWSGSYLWADGETLWVSQLGKMWRLNLSTFEVDWFQLPLDSYRCLSAFKLMWVDGNDIKFVCNPQDGSGDLILNFDVSDF